jgi:Holliday junction DNA helicase RuvB
MKQNNPDKAIIKNEEQEQQFINLLRVDTWDSFYGQEKVKESLMIAITAAKKRKEPVEHILLYGPPGLGKTSLAHLVAKSMEASIKVTSGPVLERSGDLAAILTNLSDNDILFIDEIHRLNKVVEELLYPAMEDFALDIVVGKGPSARTVRLTLPRFTIIGATTRSGLLSSPLRDRFGVVHRLMYYSQKELSHIIITGAKRLKIQIDSDAVQELSARSRGTPRIALKLLKRVRDFAQVKGTGSITKDVCNVAFDTLEVDTLGLDSNDVNYLHTIIKKFNGGPVGIETIANSMSEDLGTIEDVIEPYLMQIGLIKRTSRGRIATEKAYNHFGIKSSDAFLQKNLL